MADDHSCYRLVLIILTWLVFGVTLFFNYLSSAQVGQDLGTCIISCGAGMCHKVAIELPLCHNQKTDETPSSDQNIVGIGKPSVEINQCLSKLITVFSYFPGIYTASAVNVSDRFYLEITPAGWTFRIWAFIYSWQFLWLIYGLSTICRKTESGIYIYKLPVMTPVIYIVYILNLGCNISWMILFTRTYVNISLVSNFLIASTSYIIIFISCRALHNNLHSLIKDGAGKEAWFIRFLLQNGVAFYAAWVSVATLLNLAIVMHYSGSVANDIASSIFVAILILALMFWFFLDLILLDSYTRYLFSPYITITVALSGAMDKNFNMDVRYRNSVMMVILLAMVAFFLFVKVIVMFVRHSRSPLTSETHHPKTTDA